MKIAFNNVVKNYGSVNALNGVSFTIKPSEFVFLVGSSGAGKSTLIKLLLAQIKPSSGEININDQDLNSFRKKELDEHRRKIGVIFQDYQLIVDKTIEENIALALDISGYPQNQIKSRIDEVTTLVNLHHRQNQFPSQLSGGELQRAALARALAPNPEVILADEPTGNLDNENSWNLLRLFKKINQKFGTTILMTTHNQDFIDSLKYRTIIIDDGLIVKDLPTKES
ncbi:MAG TPA: ATP-binding cassette domain-containing protein [Candidatus Woesebacteria bacterium]|nr:ATP-binding cassette domain-containing protein [Candidatus Woesebacteria bacterium]HPJ16964.1 ATP-binding cassette domain-containing protein [Candidatus Woesebacteria bacterium]